MPEQFLHGVEVLDIDDGPRPIRTVKSSVIGLVGTAPNAQSALKAGLQLGLESAKTGLLYTAKTAGVGGNKIAVEYVDPQANDSDLSVAVDRKVITVSLATGVDGSITSTAADVKAGIEAKDTATALVAVEHVGESDGSGVLAVSLRRLLSGGENEPFPLGLSLIKGSRQKAAKLGKGGTLPAAVDDIFDQTGATIVVSRVAEGKNEAETQSNIIRGILDLLNAESVVHVEPRILIAPEFSHKEAVATELFAIADRLRAFVWVDGPDTTDEDAIAYRKKFGSRRGKVFDPWVRVYDTELDAEVIRPGSARAAGVMARTDNTLGFWHVESNQLIDGIVGTSRPINFKLGDVNSQANYLNENEVTTIIRSNGYRIWGDRTLTIDPKWAFSSVVRTADLINDSVQREHMWAVDRNITATYFEDVSEGVNNYLRHLTNIGALLGGACWVDPDLNSPDQLQQGKPYFDFDFTPSAPAEHITFRSHLVNDYFEVVVDV